MSENNREERSAMTTPPDRPEHRSGDFESLADDREVEAALEPRKTFRLPAATAVLIGIVVLAAGAAGGAGLHAALASGDDAAQPGAARPGGNGYGFRNVAPNGQNGGGPQNGTVGTIVSADKSQLVVRTQNGDVTVKLTGETDIEITDEGAVSDLEKGEQVVVSGTSTDGTLTATTVRQGGTAFAGRPTGSPSPR